MQASWIIISLLFSVTCASAQQFVANTVTIRDAVGDGQLNYDCRLPPGASGDLFWSGVDEAGESVVVEHTTRPGVTSVWVDKTAVNNNTVYTCYMIEPLPSTRTHDILHLRALFQGPLKEVSNLHLESELSSSITISWDAPFSLNLTDVEPDIQYCVDVYNVTGGGDELVESECDIIVTSFTFTPNYPSPDHLFNFIVTPRSNVPGAMNGTRSELIQGHVCRPRPQIASDVINFKSNTHLDPMQIYFSEPLNSDELCRPLSYSLEIKSTVPNYNCSVARSTINNFSKLTFSGSDCVINRHQLVKMIIHEKYNGGETVSDREINISTHDVQRPLATTGSQPGEMIVSCTYLDETTDLGVFMIVFCRNDSNITHRAGNRKQSNHTSLSIVGLPNNKCIVLTYDLESTGPRSTPAAAPLHVTIIGNSGTNQNQSPPSSLQDQPEVTSSNGEICISCSFSDTEVTGCVGVIHSAQLDNLTLTILPVERSVGMNCTNKTFSEGEYFVAVFGQIENGLEEVPALTAKLHVFVEAIETTTSESGSSTTERGTDIDELDHTGAVQGAIAGMVTFIVIMTMVVIIIMFIVLWSKKRSMKVHFGSSQCSSSPSPPRCDDLLTVRRDPGYEDVEQTWNRPVVVPSVSITRDVLSSRPVSITIDEDAPPLPPPYKAEDISSNLFVATQPLSQDLEAVTPVNKTDRSTAQFPDPENSLTPLIGPSSTNSDESNGGDSPLQVPFFAQEPTYAQPDQVMISSGPQPPQYGGSPTAKKDPGYEDVELIQTWNRPNELQPVSTTIDEDAPPVPPPCKPEDIISSSQVRLVQHGTESVVTLPDVEEPLGQDKPMPEAVTPVNKTDRSRPHTPNSENSLTPPIGRTSSTDSDDSNGGHPLHYAHVNVKPKLKGLPDITDDPTAVVYSTMDNNKLEESEVVPEPEPAPPTPPQCPTADNVLLILDSIAMKWAKLGDALGIDDDDLDRFTSKDHPEISLHEMIHYYFSSYQFKHTWEEIVQALDKIGEIKAADKIVRKYKVNVA